MPSVASGRYCPGADTAKPSLARCAGQGIYRICSFQSWAMSLLMLKTPNIPGFFEIIERAGQEPVWRAIAAGHGLHYNGTTASVSLLAVPELRPPGRGRSRFRLD